jgi:hypothetical protein
VTIEPVSRRAERARTTLAAAPVLTVTLDGRGSENVGVHAVDADGSLVLLVPADGVLGTRVTASDAVATVHAARLLPVAVPDRVLDRVAVHGRLGVAADIGGAVMLLVNTEPSRSAQVVLRPDESLLLRLEVWQARLDGDPIDPDAYVCADPDPIALRSDAVIDHLIRNHPAQVVELAHLLDPALMDAAWTVAPALVDRWGVTFHVGYPTRSHRVRLDFPAALDGPDDLPVAMQALQKRAARAAVAAHHNPRSH